MQQGLLSQAAPGQLGQQAAGPMGAAPPQGMERAGTSGPPGAAGVSPEEQQMYDTIVGQTTESIYGPMLENVKQRLQAGAADDVDDDIGAVVGNLLVLNYQGAAEAGRAIPPRVMAGAAKELTEVVTDIAVEMQLLPPGEADNVADEALYAAMAMFGKALPNMPQEEKQIYAQMIQQLEVEEEQVKGRGQPSAQPPMEQGGQPAGALP